MNVLGRMTQVQMPGDCRFTQFAHGLPYTARAISRFFAPTPRRKKATVAYTYTTGRAYCLSKNRIYTLRGGDNRRERVVTSILARKVRRKGSRVPGSRSMVLGNFLTNNSSLRKMTALFALSHGSVRDKTDGGSFPASNWRSPPWY